jgi:hypothetical protein
MRPIQINVTPLLYRLAVLEGDPPHSYMHPDDVMDYANPDNLWDSDKLEPLKRDIAANGIKTPVKIRTNGQHAILDDGHHRTWAAQELGHTSVPVHVIFDPYWEFDDGDPAPEGQVRDWLDTHGSL